MTHTTTYTERPILFSTPMVRAVWGKWKRQTRRIVKPGAWLDLVTEVMNLNGRWTFHTFAYDLTTPYGLIGDRLWVRETWGTIDGSFCYLAHEIEGVKPEGGKWKPSIHMPRFASRINLEILDIRVERLNEISEDDAMAEGIMRWDNGLFHWEKQPKGIAFNTAVDAYRALWDSINKDRGFGWETNPLVWIIEFKPK